MRSDRHAPRPTHEERIGHRPRNASRGTRLWPLYLLLLLLVAALVALGIRYQADRQRLEARLDELSSNTASVAAGREELSSNIDAALVSLRHGQMEQQQMIEAQREQLRRQQTQMEDRPDIDPASIDRRLETLAAADRAFEQSQSAQRQSLETLDEMILGLREYWEGRITRLQERLAEIESQTGSRSEALENRQQTLTARLESLDEATVERTERIEALEMQLDENSNRLEQLQQTQTQLRAAQESLRGIFAQ